MISFHYFGLVILFIPLVLGGANLSCTNENKPFEICCDGDVYQIGETIWPHESCNIEPKNETLTFADSAWLAYDCNVKKQLNSTGLTLKSYFNLLFRMRKSIPTLHWERLKFQSDISEKTVGEEEYDRIQNIKLYQNKCLEALEQVCTFQEVNSTSGNNTHFNPPSFLASMDFKTRFSYMQYSKECNNETIPYSGYFAAIGFGNTDVFFKNLKKCDQEFNYTLGNATYNKFRSSIFTFCRAIGSKDADIKAQIIRPTFDFEGIVTSLTPTFWSKSVKNSFKISIFEELKHQFKTEDLENLESLMQSRVLKEFNPEFSEGKSLTNKHDFVQAMMILQISEVFQYTARNVCRLDSPGKGNAGM